MFYEPIHSSRHNFLCYRRTSGVANRFFKHPFPSVINRYRINYAGDLLLNTEKDIVEITLLCGFGSMRNFNRSFKAVMGLPLRLYRKSKAQNERENNEAHAKACASSLL